MKMKILSAVIALISLHSACAQVLSSAPVQQEPLQISGSRKGVRISTDVAVLALPAASLAIAIAHEDWNGIAIGAGECLGTLAVTYAMKHIIHKQRPDRSNNQSFPSGHSALAFADASFLMKRYGWQYGIPAYAVAGYVAWGRTYAKKHDFWDVLTGAAIGTATGLIATAPFVKKHDVTIAPAVMETPCPDGKNTFINFGVGGSFTF